VSNHRCGRLTACIGCPDCRPELYKLVKLPPTAAEEVQGIAEGLEQADALAYGLSHVRKQEAIERVAKWADRYGPDMRWLLRTGGIVELDSTDIRIVLDLAKKGLK